MESQTLGVDVMRSATAPSRSVLVGHAILVFSAVAALLISLRGILPMPSALGLARRARLVRGAGRRAGPPPVRGTAGRMAGRSSRSALPGATCSAASSSWLSGPPASAAAWWLVLAPIPAAIAVLPAGRLAGTLSVPRLDRTRHRRVCAGTARGAGDCRAALRARRASIYPRVVPIAPISRPTSSGRWPSSPRSPKATCRLEIPTTWAITLHYYWLMHLLPSAEHRALGRALDRRAVAPRERALVGPDVCRVLLFFRPTFRRAAMGGGRGLRRRVVLLQFRGRRTNLVAVAARALARRASVSEHRCHDPLGTSEPADRRLAPAPPVSAPAPTRIPDGILCVAAVDSGPRSLPGPPCCSSSGSFSPWRC